MKASVIMSTYNAEAWLEKVLWGYSVQTERDFEIVIADDGSQPQTKELIDRLRRETGLPVTHVWHPDHGFRKTEILNKAIVASKSDYLIFTDGDCIPRKDFVARHLALRRAGCFLSGGYFKLPMNISHTISKDDILTQRCFDLVWLKASGLKNSFKNSKFIVNHFWASVLNFITTTKPSWNGHNASGWKKDILSVNGFNQDMCYGGEDREFGERLNRAGVRSRQIRYSAICVHLDHARGYADEAGKIRNYEIRKHNKQHGVTVARNGIETLDYGDGACESRPVAL
jgi:glycosyltransferase involved in cell wall biosynthesis